jgi:hypothetical protein
MKKMQASYNKRMGITPPKTTTGNKANNKKT